jgi:hypothetical protein
VSRPAGLATAAAATVAAVIAGTAPAAAALPDWVTTLAAAAPPLPAEVATRTYRVLLSEERVAIQPDGAVRLRRRIARQIMSARDGSLSTEMFSFDASARILTSRAWHLPPGEKGRRSHELPIDIAAGGSFLSDNRVRAMTVEGVRRGSLLFYEFEAMQRPLFLSLAHTFLEDAPLVLGRFQVETPPGWEVHIAWAHSPGPAPAVDGMVRTWELRDRPAPEVLPLSDPPFARAPLILVHATPPAGVKTPAAAWSDWPGMSAWYEELARGRADATPAIEAAARRIAPPEGAAFFDKVMAAARFVRDSVRYTAIELGVGGYQPRSAAETLENLFGDCKDKATLFRALLASAGIGSHWVIVRVGAVDEVPVDVAVGWFNHVVTAVPIPEGLEIPAPFRPAVATAGDGRRFLIVDTTDDRTAIGSLAAGLESRRGLLVDGSRGGLLTFPGGDPEAHRVVRTTAVSADARGAVTIRRTSTLAGEPAAVDRAGLARSAVERRRDVEAAIAHRWPGATVKEYEVTAEDAEGHFRETLAFTTRPAAPGASLERMALFPWINRDVESASLTRRTVDVVYPHPLALRYDTAVAGAAGQEALPQPRTISGQGWSITIESTLDGDGVRGRAEVLLSKTRFKPAEFDELRRFWAAVAAVAGAAVVPGRPGGAS